MFRIVRRLIHWMGQYKKRIYIGFLCAFAHGVFSAIPLLLAAYGIELVLDDYHGGRSLQLSSVLALAGVMIVAVLGRFLFAYLRSMTQESVGYEMTADERICLGDIFKRVSLGFYSENNLGELSAAITTDLSFLEMYAMNMINTVVNGYITVAVMILFLIVFCLPAGLLALSGVLCSLVFLALLEKQSRKNAPAHQKAQDDIVATTIEYLRGMQVVKAFKQEGVTVDGIRQAYRHSKDVNIKIEAEYMPFNCLYLFVLKAAAVGIVAVAAVLTMNGSMSLASMIMLDLFSFSIYASIENMNNAAHVLEVIDTTLDKLEHIKNAEIIDANGQAIDLQSYDIEFNDVSFSYETREILHNLNFKIEAGETVAIVGPSGSGKTTICNLISRFYDVDSGSISIGGINIKELTCDSLLSNLSMVFQNVYLFQDTIENNIRFGNPQATEAEIKAAAQKAQCHDFIIALPEGYQTIVGETGSNLSEGEKQRISIARAILKGAPIVILDEATASVDPENEYLIQQAINHLTVGKTVIVIAHRLATIEHADKILVVEEGRIVQAGTHQELIKEEGVYADFIKIREQSENWAIV